jgi:hypothetical protein
VTRFEQRGVSWPRYPSERLGEDVSDLITMGLEIGSPAPFFCLRPRVIIPHCALLGPKLKWPHILAGWRIPLA